MSYHKSHICLHVAAAMCTHGVNTSHIQLMHRMPSFVGASRPALADLPGLWSQAGDARTKSVWPEQVMGCLLQHASRIYIHTCTYSLISTCIHSNDLHVCSIEFIEGGRHVCGRTVRVHVYISGSAITRTVLGITRSRDRCRIIVV